MMIVKPQNSVRTVRVNLICFHWAGGSGTAYKDLGQTLEPIGVRVFSVTLPGRNGRGVEQIPKRMERLVKEVKVELEKLRLDDGPILFFGHSLGGLLAFELIRAIQTEGSNLRVEKLIVSAVHSPICLTEKNRDESEVFHHRQTDEELFAYVKSIGGLPKGVDPAFLRMMMPTIKADYEIFETYDIANFPSCKVQCPFVIFFARGDASVSVESAIAWVDECAGACQTVEFNRGSHFYLMEHKDLFVERLLAACGIEKE